MGCVLALCLPFDVKKSRWVTPLSEASVASRGRRRLPRRRGRRLVPSDTSCKSGQMCPDLIKRRNRPRTSPTPRTPPGPSWTSWRPGTSSRTSSGRRRRRSGRPRPRPRPQSMSEVTTKLCYHKSLFPRRIKTKSTRWVVSRETKEENTTHVSFCFQECKHWSQQKVHGLWFLNLD